MDEAIKRRSRKHEIWAELERCRVNLANSQQIEVILKERVKDLESELARVSEQTKYSIDRQKRLTSENERLHLILDFLKDISALDVDRLLATAVQKLPYILQARTISIYLHDPERRTLVLKDSNHSRPIDRLIDLNEARSSLMALAVRTRQTLIVSDVGDYELQQQGDLSFPNRERYGTPSCMVTPILLGDEIFGIFNVADRFDGRPFDRADREAINHLATFMALSLSNARKVEELRRSGPLDPLTGLRNQRSFMEIFKLEVQRSTRYRCDLSLIVINIHNFSWINGNYGYPAGDAVLQQMGRLIANHVRDVDIAARMGGDEFAILLPEQNLNGALDVARRVRTLLTDHSFKVSSHTLKVQVTLGVVQSTRSSEAIELLRAAESSLNEARRRNETIGVKT